MEPAAPRTLQIGAWSVDPLTNKIVRDGETVRLEARTMRLLLCLAEHPGETVTADELMDRVWTGTIVTPDSIYQAVAYLRRLLGDDAKTPAYIATVPRRGYRLVAKVVKPTDAAPVAAPLVVPDASVHAVQRPASGWQAGIRTLGAAALGAGVLGLGIWWLAAGTGSHRAPSPALAYERSVAVLPFLDLTSQAMGEEYLADGITEELIDELSKVPGLKVPPPSAVFYFKSKLMEPAVIARTLRVAYLVDGSVRRSGARLRIAVRLTRAADGFIVWSASYDRQPGDLLKLQSDIAGNVSKEIQATRAWQSSLQKR
jgi:TolB-like protein/DNA-binding winged helix-turn-helix (wHTH) protein